MALLHVAHQHLPEVLNQLLEKLGLPPCINDACLHVHEQQLADANLSLSSDTFFQGTSSKTPYQRLTSTFLPGSSMTGQMNAASSCC